MLTTREIASDSPEFMLTVEELAVQTRGWRPSHKGRDGASVPTSSAGSAAATQLSWCSVRERGRAPTQFYLWTLMFGFLWFLCDLFDSFPQPVKPVKRFLAHEPQETRPWAGFGW